MIEPLPLNIAAWTGALTLALFVAAALALSVVGWFRKGGGAIRGDIVGRLLGFALFCLLPLGFLSILGFVAAVAVTAAGTPPIAFPFVTLAGIAGLRVANKAKGRGEMGGCNRIIGFFVATYAAVWGAVAWWATGGVATLGADLASLRWLQPPLAAFPFAIALWRIAGMKRTAWLLVGALIFLSAYFALWFFSIEAGLGAETLPASDWLRFPLAGLAAGLLLSALPLARALNQHGARRTRALRDSARSMFQFALITLPMGLAWSLSRAIVGLL